MFYVICFSDHVARNSAAVRVGATQKLRGLGFLVSILSLGHCLERVLLYSRCSEDTRSSNYSESRGSLFKVPKDKVLNNT